MNKLEPPPKESGKNPLSGTFYTYPDIFNITYILELIISGSVTTLIYFLSLNVWILGLSGAILSVFMLIRSNRRRKISFVPRASFQSLGLYRHFFDLVYTSFLISLVSYIIFKFLLGEIPENPSWLFGSKELTLFFFPIVFSALAGWILGFSQQVKLLELLLYGPGFKEQNNKFMQEAKVPEKPEGLYNTPKLESFSDRVRYRELYWIYNMSWGDLSLFLIALGGLFLGLYFNTISVKLSFLVVFGLATLIIFYLFWRKVLVASRDEFVKMIWISKELRNAEWDKVTLNKVRKYLFLGMLLALPLALLSIEILLIAAFIIIYTFTILFTLGKLLISLKLR